MTQEEKLKLKDRKIQDKKEPMKEVMVNTLDGKMSLYDLCEVVGIKERTAYFNFIEKKASKKEYSIKKPTVVKKIVFDKGFTFNDGFQIRHVESKYWKLYSEAPMVEIRERKI